MSVPADGRRALPGGRAWFVALFAAALLHFVARVAIPMLATDRFYDDYRQNFFWLVQVHAGLDFRDRDPLTRYARDFQPPALAWICERLARVVDPYPLAKAMGLMAVTSFVVSCWGLGESLSRGSTGPLSPRAAGAGGAFDPGARFAMAPILASLVLVDEPWIREMVGGLARSFGAPLQAAIAWAVVAESWWWAAGLLALAGLVHPQSLLLGGSLVAVGMGGRMWLERGSAVGRAWGPMKQPALACALVVLALAVFNGLHSRAVEAHHGRLLSRGEILASIDYGAGGRFRNERPNLAPIEAARVLAAHLGVPSRWLDRLPVYAPVVKQGAGSVVVLGAAIGLFEFLRRMARGSWREIGWFPPAALGIALSWNVLAFALLPRLYFPRRFLGVLLPLSAFVVAARWLDLWSRREEGSPATHRPPKAALVVAAAVALCALRFEGGAPGFRDSPAEFRHVAEFLASQPADLTYAARPEGDADTLIAMVPRQVYIASEIAHPLFTRFRDEVVRRRTRICVRALYPEDPPADVGSLRREGVALLVARRADLRRERIPVRFFDEPYLSEVTAYWNPERYRAMRAFWARWAESATVYSDRTWVVFDLRRIDFER